MHKALAALLILGGWLTAANAAQGDSRPAAKASVSSTMQRAKPKTLSMPAPIAKMVAGGSVVIERASGPGSLSTWIMGAPGGAKRFFYVTADGNTLILGLAFDADLNNISTREIKRLEGFMAATAPPPMAAPTPTALAVPAAAAPPVDVTLASVTRAINLARKAQSHVEGNGADLYVVFDPSCPYCQELFRDTRTMMSGLRIHWIPAAVISAGSAGLVESYLNTKDRAAGLAAMEKRTLPQSPTVSDATRKILAEGALILAEGGSTGVPFLLYTEKGQPKTIIGNPEQNVLRSIAANGDGGSRRK